MLNRFKNIILALSLSVCLVSCATIMHGTHQKIGISSNPTNAAVWIDQVYLGVTPMLVDLSRQDNHFLRIEIPGYLPYDAVFSRQLSGWVFGNVIFGGVIGLAIDAISGGIYKLTPDQIQAEMRANSFVSNGERGESYIAVVLEADPSWEKIDSLQSNHS